MGIKLINKIIEILLNFSDKMKNVIIRNIYAVGMHHWGPREIPIDVVHYCKWETMNPRDNCAVAIYADEGFTRTVAYFRREDSSVLYQLFRDKLIEGQCYVKAKKPVSKFSRRTGPMQSVSIGFKSSESNIPVIENITANYERIIY